MVIQNLKFLENEFNILEKIGQGGMGTVFKAKQVSMDRIVAIKWLHADFCRNSVFIDRFKREARITGKFCHPNSVQVFDIGENEGNHYYVMEYVEGMNLKEKLHLETRFDQKYVIKIMKQVLSVLKEAEKMGIIHRDIKPENILLTKDDIVKVADLGLAREIDDDASLTQHNIAIGTPQYMSPEQAQGKPVDTRSDQYSLGITAFHMLTGRVPFQGKNTMEVLLKQVKDPMIKPSSMCKEVSPLMDKIIMRMTEKKPELRYKSIDEISSDLEKVSIFLNQKKTTKRKKASKSNTIRNNPNNLKKNSGISWISILVVAVLTISASAAVYYFSPAKNQARTSFSTDPITIANNLITENRLEESVLILRNSLINMTPNEQIKVVQKVNEVEKKIVEFSASKIMSQALNSLKDSERSIVELNNLIEKYSSNAELAKKNRSILEERISLIKAEEKKILDQSIIKENEEELNKLSLEVNSLLLIQNYKQANASINNFQNKNNLSDSKIQLLRESVKDHEESFASEAFKKSDDLTNHNEFDKSNLYLNSIKINLSQKEIIEKLESHIKNNEKLKNNQELEATKKNQKLITQSKESIFALLKIAEFKPAKSKLEQFKINGLPIETYDFLMKVMTNYEEISGKIEKDLINDYKSQLNLKQLGSRNINVEINSICSGVIQYKFLDSKLELTPTNEDWAQVYTAIAIKTTKINKGCRLLKISHFAYVNGDLEGAYLLWKEAESLGFDPKEQSKFFKPIDNEYLNWLDIHFDSVLEKTKLLISENNKIRANIVLKDFIKKYESSIIYQERKQEVDALLNLLSQN